MNITDSQTVKRWLSRLSENTRVNRTSIFVNWYSWLQENGGEFAGLSPDELIEYQQKAFNNGDRFKVLDLLQDYIVSRTDLRYSTKDTYYTTVRSFFMHNRAELPNVRFNITSDVPRVMGTLTPEEIRDIILSSNKLYQAGFTCMFQGAMDQESFTFWNLNGWGSLRDQLMKETEVIKVDLPGRKKQKNVKGFYTFIGPDGVNKLLNYLPEPLPVERKAIFLDQYKDPLSKSALRLYWKRHSVNIGAIKLSKDKEITARYGKNLHEMRDVFRSQWSKSPAKYEVGEFVMGHTVDPLQYDKSSRDVGFYRNEYIKALPLLQILSSDRPYGKVDVNEMEKQAQRIKELETELAKRDGALSSLREDVTKLMAEFRAWKADQDVS